MDQNGVTVGVEDGGGGVATCGRAVRWRIAVARSRQQRRGGGRGTTDERRMKRESR